MRMDDLACLLNDRCVRLLSGSQLCNGLSSQKSVLWRRMPDCGLRKRVTGTVPDERGCVLSSPTRCRWYGC